MTYFGEPANRATPLDPEAIPQFLDRLKREMDAAEVRWAEEWPSLANEVAAELRTYDDLSESEQRFAFVTDPLTCFAVKIRARWVLAALSRWPFREG